MFKLSGLKKNDCLSVTFNRDNSGWSSQTMATSCRDYIPADVQVSSSYPGRVSGGHEKEKQRGRLGDRDWPHAPGSRLCPRPPQSGLPCTCTSSRATQSAPDNMTVYISKSLIYGLRLSPNMAEFVQIPGSPMGSANSQPAGGSGELNEQPSPREWPGIRAWKPMLHLSRGSGATF